MLLQAALSRYWLVLGLALCPPAMAVEVIVNVDVADQTISQSTLRAIFCMRMRQWPNGKPIKVFVLPEQNTVHVSFSKEVLNTFPYQLKRSWDVLVFSGSGQAPSVAESPKEMLQKVSSTPGAIGYMPEDYPIEGGNNENVHILQSR
jgi:ABC-type phosphate transport system substrate-binding protein